MHRKECWQMLLSPIQVLTQRKLCGIASHLRLIASQEEEYVLPVSEGMYRQELDIHSDSLKLYSAKVHCDKQEVTSQ